MELVLPQTRNSARGPAVHLADCDVPDRVLLAGNRIPESMEVVLVHIPDIVRLPCVHQPEYGGMRTLSGRESVERAAHTDWCVLPLLSAFRTSGEY